MQKGGKSIVFLDELTFPFSFAPLRFIPSLCSKANPLPKSPMLICLFAHFIEGALPCLCGKTPQWQEVTL
jgi:hypothetical protein